MLDAINTNVLALQTQNSLAKSQMSVATSIQRLSSGLRINSAQDDPAGLAIADGMQAQLSGLNQATSNANDGVSMLQTADGGYASTGSILQTMRGLAVEAANGTMSTTDLAATQTEMTQLQNEIQQIATTTQYNGINLLDGSLTNVQFQVGANAGQTITMGLGNAQSSSIGTNIYNTNDTAQSGAESAANTPVVGASPVANGVAASAAITIVGKTSQTITANATAGEQISAIAASINQVTAQTGVTASASTSTFLSQISSGAQSIQLYYGESSAGTVTSGVTNSVSIDATVTTGTGAAGYQNLINQINSYSGTTGVSATYSAGVTGATGPGIVLSNSTGDDIALQNNTGAGTFNMSGLTYATVPTTDPTATPVLTATAGTAVAAGDLGIIGGSLQLTSANGFSVSGDASVLGGTPGGSQLAAVNGIDLTQVTNGQPTGANLALQIIDGAISQVDTARASVGAYQNRFTAAVSNLQSASLNLTSSLSTEQDANFASETTNLSRGQILQQAGTAMLAQANSLPNGVLALLR